MCKFCRKLTQVAEKVEKESPAGICLFLPDSSLDLLTHTPPFGLLVVYSAAQRGQTKDKLAN